MHSVVNVVTKTPPYFKRVATICLMKFSPNSVKAKDDQAGICDLSFISIIIITGMPLTGAYSTFHELIYILTGNWCCRRYCCFFILQNKTLVYIRLLHLLGY